MIDYFALLDQPRAPWLDPDRLKEIYHQKTLQAHPDTQGSRSETEGAESSFADLNEAYQVLQDHKRRLHHLLSLEGHAPSNTDQTVPTQLHDLFPVVGALTQRTKPLLEEIQRTSSALSRSLLKPQILAAQNETNEVRRRVQDLSDASLSELQQLNAAWVANRGGQIKDLSNLYFVFAYLTRWSAQLDEMTFQLSLH